MFSRTSIYDKICNRSGTANLPILFKQSSNIESIDLVTTNVHGKKTKQIKSFIQKNEKEISKSLIKLK